MYVACAGLGAHCRTQNLHMCTYVDTVKCHVFRYRLYENEQGLPVRHVRCACAQIATVAMAPDSEIAFPVCGLVGRRGRLIMTSRVCARVQMRAYLRTRALAGRPMHRAPKAPPPGSVLCRFAPSRRGPCVAWVACGCMRGWLRCGGGRRLRSVLTRFWTSYQY